jgi:spore germination protein GerM
MKIIGVMAKKRNTLGCLVYIALVLLVLVVFLFNRGRDQEALEKTGLTKLFEKKPEAPADIVVTPLEGKEEEEDQLSETEPESGAREVVITVEKDKPPESVPERKGESESQIRSRQSRLFFIAVTGEGKITMKGVIRPVEYVDAPLTATLEALLQGPTTAEVNQGLMSLISPQTRLRTVYIKGETAHVDFNEAFRFNSLGKEGLIAELQQVVYTATEFPTVKKVQILVEGEISTYLGPEGVVIDKPLGRDSF